MKNKDLLKLGILLVGAFVFCYIMIYLPNQNKKRDFDQQIKCQEYGQKKFSVSETTKEIDAVLNTARERNFVYSKKLNTCLLSEITTNMNTFEKRYYLRNLFTNELIASFHDGCTNSTTNDNRDIKESIKCTSTLEEFNSKKE